MTGIHVTLSCMLARREARALEQLNFLQKHHSPLISFSMNIPGPIKTNSLIRKAFLLGRDLLLSQLEITGAKILDASEFHQDTGDELLLAIGSVQPEILKDIAVNIEDTSELGRLYDIDVIAPDGKKLSRTKFRKCLICNKQAQECARSRTHSVSDMQAVVENILVRHIMTSI